MREVETAKTRTFKEDLLSNSEFQGMFDNFYFNIDVEVALDRKAKKKE